MDFLLHVSTYNLGHHRALSMIYNPTYQHLFLSSPEDIPLNYYVNCHNYMLLYTQEDAICKVCKLPIVSRTSPNVIINSSVVMFEYSWTLIYVTTFYNSLTNLTEKYIFWGNSQSHPFWFNHTNRIKWDSQLYNVPCLLATWSCLRPNNFLNIQFSNSLNLCSSVRMSLRTCRST
jgi:hypothetical protein